MSLLGFKAQNHPQQVRRDDIDDRRTPRAFFDKLHAERGFTVDAAANQENHLLPMFWSIAEDGLWQSWSGHRVWCNPPYSNIRPWLEKAWDEMFNGGCASVDMLLPANRTEQPWWHLHVEPWRDAEARSGVRLTTRFVRGRLRFSGPNGPIRSSKDSGPPFGVVLLQWSRVTAPISHDCLTRGV